MEPQSTWGDLFREMLSNPAHFIQTHWLWLFGVLVLLFVLSKLNNFLEVKSVNQAIFLSRGFVGGLMAFVVTPIAFLLLVNLVAWLNGLPLIDMWRFWEWFKLTGTTFWWLAECIFDFGEAPTSEVAFTVSSAIRVLWVAIPILFIWIRTADTRFWKLMSLVFLAGLLVLTAYRDAKPTFLDKHVPESWLAVAQGDFSEVETEIHQLPDFQLKEKADDFYGSHRMYIMLGLLSFVVVGLALGYFTTYKIHGLLLVVLGLLGFIYLAKQATDEVPAMEKPKQEEKVTYTVLHQLYKEFDALYAKQNGQPSVELTELSFKITAKLKEKNEKPPKRFCEVYHDYFFDFCD